MGKVIINNVPEPTKLYVGLLLREKITNFCCSITSIDKYFEEVYMMYCDGSTVNVTFDELRKNYVIGSYDYSTKADYLIEYMAFLQEIEEEWMQQSTKG